MSRASRIVGKVFRYVALGVAALLLITAGIFLYLTTDAGERRIASYLKSSVDESIAGYIELENLEFHGDSLELYGLTIMSPDGETVLAVKKVNLDIALGSVLSDQLVVEELVVREYTVRIRRQDGQTSLQAALEPTVPSDDETSVRIDKLELVDGTVVADLGEPEALAFQVNNLDVSGSLVTGENLRFDLAGTGQVEDMAPGKLAIALTLEQTQNHRQELAFDASLDSNTLYGQIALPDELAKDLRVSDIEGSLSAAISSFEHQGLVYGPMNIDVHLSDERIEVEEALVELPGLRLHREPAEGDAVVLVVALRSLSQTSRALSQLLGMQAPSVAGSGDITMRFSNPITSPQLAFEGTMRDLRWGESDAQPVTVRRLMLEGGIEDLTRLRNGHVRAELDQLRKGERSVASASLDATLDKRELSLDARVGAPYRAELHLEAERISEDEARINTLTLSYPRADWQAAQPAYLNFGGSLEDLVLVSGEQGLEIDAGWDPAPRIDARLSKFQLATLPRSVLEDMPEARGILNAEVQLEIQDDVVSGEVSATLANWEIAPASGERAALDARIADQRVTGTFSMQAYGGKVDATFDAPMSPDQNATVDAEIHAQSLQLAAMWRDLSGEIESPSATKIQSVSGQLGGLVRLSGTARQLVPSGRLRLSNGALTLSDGNEYQDIRLLITGTEKRVRIRELVVHAGAGQVSVNGTATRIRSGRYHYNLRFDANDFPLPGEEPMLATVAGALKGRASRGQVEAELSFRDVVVEGQPAGEAEREIALTANRNTASRR